MDFASLGLIPPILDAVAEQGYDRPTPIQQRAIPHVLTGGDLLGLAQTGTGKTAAFALPMLQRLVTDGSSPKGARPIRALILTPTRELASQVGESFMTYGKYLRLRTAVIFGGVGIEPQKRTLRAGVDVLVATPGRLLDLAGQNEVHLDKLGIFVLDEADRMLDMGFIHDVRKIIRLLPPKGSRQTLFFSATMPPEAQELADQLLVAPQTVAVTPVSSTAERIEQSVYFVDRGNKRHLLVDLLKANPGMKRVLVFSRMKHACNRIAEFLEGAGIGAAAIHGNKSQGARERALAGFRDGKVRVLVATDIAARGIDIDEITHVINYDLPEVPETYVHRIGRTARAGTSGVAYAFCEPEDHDLLRGVERLIRMELEAVPDHAYPSSTPYSRGRGAQSPARPPQGRGGGQGQRPARGQGQGRGGGHGPRAPRR